VLALAAVLAPSPSGAAPPAAPTAPACLVDGGRVPFAGHAFPLDGTPQPVPMSAVDAFPQLPSFTQPVFLTSAGDGTRRLFVVERAGRIVVFDPSAGATQFGVFLDIRGIVHSASQEEGLLGLAFPPDYATSGQFYVSYVAPQARCTSPTSTCVRIARYTTSADPNLANAQSEAVLIDAPQPFANHKGGMLAFGPDGMLYASLGDGGDAGDPFNNAQNRASLLGKILRIDPRAGSPYAIPPTNPYAGNTQGWRPEIWAYGLRNPWRFSFDRVTGELWIGDVGQNDWEEIDRLAPGQGGVNFGWRPCEGSHSYAGYDCASLGATPPLLEYPHDPNNGGYAVTGGYVYRGAVLPQLAGAYVYADYVTGPIWAFTGSGAPVRIATLQGVSGFGEDADGELYLVRFTDGRIHRLVPAGGGGGAGFPTKLSATGLFSDLAALVPAPGLVEYRVSSPLWSDGAAKRRWIGLPGSAQIGFDPTGPFDFPLGTVLVKHFEIATGFAATRRLETRVLLRQNAGQGDGWIAYTYRWNDAQTDADLVTTGQLASHAVDFGSPGTLTWYYPGPGDCLTCHTAAEGRVLGVRTRQLNLDWSCQAGTENQLGAWSALGLFTTGLGAPSAYDAYADPGDFTASIGRRARSYLAANCAMCHQPLGPAPGGLDLRYGIATSAMNVANVPVTEGNLGLPGALRLAPGDHARSMLWHRLQLTDPAVRMAKGTRVPDPLGAFTIAAWIDADPTRDADGDGVTDDLDNCPGVANAGQEDRGGIGAAAAPDRTGDACQCGDVSGDGRVTLADAGLVLRSQLVPPTATLARPGLCDVGGAAGCSAGDAMILARALLQPPTATILPRCVPASP
jgi:uncharacterized repeat protein (TIGR03806 family)